jgi:hypothetical protein
MLYPAVDTQKAVAVKVAAIKLVAVNEAGLKQR